MRAEAHLLLDGATGARTEGAEMDTKERLTTEAPIVVRSRGSRKGPVAVIAGVLVTVGLAVGIGVTQTTAPGTRTAQAAISVPAGRTQPATLIHRISMQGAADPISVPKGRVQPATEIYRISMRPAPAQRAH
jgi:hypothetical protein